MMNNSNEGPDPRAQNMEYIFQISDLQESSQNIAFLLIIIGVGVAVRLMCSLLKKRHLYYPMVLLTGFFSGLVINDYQYADIYNFSLLSEINPNVYLLIFLPIMLFHTAFSMDYHGFGHSTFQVLIISILGFPVQGILLALVFYNLHDSWTYEVAITFSIICCIIEAEIVFQELNKTQERVKHIQLLLRGEQLATLATATFAFRVNFEHYYGATDTSTFFFITMLWQILAIFVGMVSGFFFSCLFIRTSNEIPVAVALTVFAALISFYLAHVHISQSGVIATIVTAVMLSPTKLKTTSDVEAQLIFYWEWFSYIINTIAFAVPGIIVGLQPYFIDFKRFIYVIVVYISCCITRCTLYVITWPLLLKVGHYLSWKNIAVVIVGPYRAAPALIIAMLYRHYSPIDGQEVLTYIAMLCILSTSFNGFFLPILLNRLGMMDLTHARAVNMRNALATIQENRNKAIISLKMDRVLADANWTIVEESTRIANPQIKSQEEGLETKLPDVFETRKATCLNCEEECPVLPTKKELMDLEIEAKHRILKVQLVSLGRQYETGVLSKTGMRVWSSIIQNSMEKEDPRVDINEIEMYYAPPKYTKYTKNMLELILRKLPQKYEFGLIPRVRPTLFKAINTLSYRFILTFLTVLDTYLILNHSLHRYWPSWASISLNVLHAFNFVFYLIFITEFILLIFSLGCVQYFKRQFHKIDFTCNVLIRTTEILMVLSHFIKTGNFTVYKPQDQFVLDFIKLVLILRLNRLYTVVEVVVWKLLHILENRLDNILVQYFDAGKAFIIANDRTLKHLRHIVQDKTIYPKLRKILEEDRRKVAKSIGIIQKERPNVAVTIKTRHAIRLVINEMNDCINDIYDEGIGMDLDPDSPKSVDWNYVSSKTTSLQMKFVNCEFKICEAHARLVNYNYQDIIIDLGDDPAEIGLLVLVSGLVKCVYKPTESTIQNCRKYGALPNCDFLTSLKYEQSQEDFVACGNVIGELGAVTGRNFDMAIICESAVQAYYIPASCMRKVLFEELDNYTNIFSKIWKSVGVRVAWILVQYTSVFQGWLREKTLYYLERAFVPNLMGVEELFLNEMVADVILIEGMVMDGNLKTVYYAPFYIPRTTNRLILPGTNKWNMEPEYATRLLIVPSKYADEIDIMGPGGIIRDKETVGMQLHTTESSFVLPLALRTREYKKHQMSYYIRPPSKFELQKQLKHSSELIKPPVDESSETFSSDSDIPRLKMFQKNVNHAVTQKPLRKVRMTNFFRCIEDVMEQSDGIYEEDIYDYERQKVLMGRKLKKKELLRKENEDDVEIQTDLTTTKMDLDNESQDVEWWWG